MRHSTQRLCAVLAASFLLSFTPQHVYADQIQMLPPSGLVILGTSTIAGYVATSPCTGGHTLLSYSASTTQGTSGINCSGLTTDAGGDLIVPNTLTANGSAIIASSVGIGTTAPQATLDVHGTSPLLQVDTVGIGSTDQAAIALLTNGTGGLGTVTNNGWVMYGRGNNYNIGDGTESQELGFAFWNGTSWHHSLDIDTSGRVGIGTVQPQATLDVNGSANVSGSLTIGGVTVNAATASATNALASLLTSCAANGGGALSINSSGNLTCGGATGSTSSTGSGTTGSTTPSTPTTPASTYTGYWTVVTLDYYDYGGAVNLTLSQCQQQQQYNINSQPVAGSGIQTFTSLIRNGEPCSATVGNNSDFAEAFVCEQINTQGSPADYPGYPPNTPPNYELSVYQAICE